VSAATPDAPRAEIPPSVLASAEFLRAMASLCIEHGLEVFECVAHMDTEVTPEGLINHTRAMRITLAPPRSR